MKSRHRLALLLGAAVFGSQLFAQNPPVNDRLNLRFANGIAAIAEQKVITVDDVRREITPLIPELQRSSRNEQEFNRKLEALQDEVIQSLVDRVLIVKEFYRDEKRHIPESYVDNALSENIISQFDGDRSKFHAYLKDRGITTRDYRREIEEDIIYSYMRAQQRKSQSIVSPMKVEAYYAENKDVFYQDDAVHLRLIQFARTEGSTDDELRAKGRDVLRRLINGETFEALAKELSEDSRRARGGDWGWQKRGDLKKEFSTPLFALEKGQATDPILLPEGCFVLFVEDRRYAGLQPLDEVRSEIERLLVQQMARQSQERWLERLRRNAYVKLY